MEMLLITIIFGICALIAILSIVAFAIFISYFIVILSEWFNWRNHKK